MVINELKIIIDSIKKYFDNKFKNSRPNWEQNNANVDDYIKNRTHYDSRKTITNTETISITYDGNMDGKETVQMNPVMFFVKVSDTPIIVDDIINYTVNYSDGSSESIIGNYIDFVDDAGSMVLDGIIIAAEDIEENVIFPGSAFSKGVWFAHSVEENFYITSLSKTITTNTVEGELKQLDEKYIPDNIVRFSDLKTGIVLIDEETGIEYTVKMSNGKIVYMCSCLSITIDTLPTKFYYGINSTIDTTGMIVIAEYEDGVIREIDDYICECDTSTVGVKTVTIRYIVNGKETNATFEIEVIEYFDDFTYTDNGDGTYTITGWKGTKNGVSSTDMMLPDAPIIIL